LIYQDAPLRRRRGAYGFDVSRERVLYSHVNIYAGRALRRARTGIDINVKDARLIADGGRQWVELRFGWSDVHQENGDLLREWVKRLPGRQWDSYKKAWVIDVDLLTPGMLRSAGFTVLDVNGKPARRLRVLKPPPRPMPAADIPDWFGLCLYEFQRVGAIRLLREGKWMLADEPGLGKTRTALAAAAAMGARRVLIACPTSVIAHWEREARDAFAALEQFDVAAIRAGRKEPPLPAAGLVVVSDSMLAKRAHLVDALCAWAPDCFVYDEVHRAKTWSSKRSVAAGRIAEASGRTLALSGTPMLSRPDELAAALDMIGLLGSVFGGRREFTMRYCRVDRYGHLQPNRGSLGELRRKLDSHVWVRRLKKDVLQDLPSKSRQVMWLEIDAAPVRDAHKAVYAKIDQWLDELEHEPSEDELNAWCSGSLALVSSMRKAAGLAKVRPLVEMISDYTACDSRPHGRWDRPLVVWAHHKDVISALAQAVPAAVGGAQVIAGETPGDRRSEIVARFQEGLVPVLVCSLTAASVGITLTRSADVLFAEVDWTPALVAQAEDRCARIGQTRPVQITTCMAKETLDETVAMVLRRKTEILRTVMLGDDHAAFDEDDGSPAGWVLKRIVLDRIRQRHAVKKTVRVYGSHTSSSGCL